MPQDIPSRVWYIETYAHMFYSYFFKPKQTKENCSSLCLIDKPSLCNSFIYQVFAIHSMYIQYYIDSSTVMFHVSPFRPWRLTNGCLASFLNDVLPLKMVLCLILPNFAFWEISFTRTSTATKHHIFWAYSWKFYCSWQL